MEVEQEALQLGWIPQDQFRGDPAKWTDAETFVTRGKEILPILRKNNEKLQGTVEHLGQEVTTLKGALATANEAMGEFRRYHEETAKRAYDSAVRDLRAQKLVALEDGDHAAVMKIDDALVDLNKEAPKALKAPAAAPVPPAPVPTVHPDYPAWETENAAWLADPAKKAYAVSMASYIRATSSTAEGRPFLDKVAAEVEKRFGNSDGVSKVEGGTRATGRSSGKGYSDLPADAKAACDRMGAKLVGTNKAFPTADAWRKSYISNYDWS